MDLFAALGQAFAIQCFFIPVLKKNKKAHKHKLYLFLSFILGSIAYAYIGFMGSYGTTQITKAYCIVISGKPTPRLLILSKVTFRLELGRSMRLKLFIWCICILFFLSIYSLASSNSSIKKTIL